MAMVAASDLNPSQNFLASKLERPPARAAATTVLGEDWEARFLEATDGVGVSRGARGAPPPKTRGARLSARPSKVLRKALGYLRFFETSLVISNIET